ncbi:L,D-transpeptidase [Actinacidiphila oryziradicis]|uniref:L,D-TPase catalytic domain-containing protein n=1 Tax=Actinacidiphila oryziradicis TaxID=2571141 RepID=A0A4U0SCC3_9ACTN|nr:Ig-like domain-containing protein [Actinacidiphila oryziradicis]TKA06238.1 hypothetical protein FCI23_33140 [Actinacidiphila oryziradicis]
MRQRSIRRLDYRTAALAAAAGVVLAGCSSPSKTPGGGAQATGGGSASSAAPAISIEPATDSSKVSIQKKVTVRAAGGTLSSVTVSSPGPGKVGGSWSKDKATWTSTTALAPGATYTVTARGTASGGKALANTSTFTTEAAQNSFAGTYAPDKGTTVGVGMPVSITFNKPITDKAAVERKLSVTASPTVEGAWSWMKDRDGKDRIDYRPKMYWKPGTAVTLRVNLAGVDAGGGVYGTQDRIVGFTIGKSVVTTIDVVRKQLTLAESGKVVETLPVSTGKAGFETWNGTMVVLSKVPSITMDSKTVKIFGTEAYNLKDVKWDVQLTPSGTYTHAAPWNEGKFGKINGSHGCIGMSTTDAKRFYERVQPGDPVTVVKSKDTVPTNNGYGDWNVDWATWKAGSALV